MQCNDCHARPVARLRFSAGPVSRATGRAWQSLHCIFRHPVHFYPVHESDRDHTGLRIADDVPGGSAGVRRRDFSLLSLHGDPENGPINYAKHFMGPMPFLAPLMILIEIISHLARPLSLTIRLYANMFAGEQVTMIFLSLTYFLIPVVFMGLHIFVSLLQAYIFMLLTMMYVAGAVAHEH